MRHAVRTGLPMVSGMPSEYAVLDNGILYTTLAPVRPDGSMEIGDAATQLDRILTNLKISVEAAGGTMDDVIQVLVSLTDRAHLAAMNEAWRRYFKQPYPQRSTVIVAGLVQPEVVVQLVAYARPSSEADPAAAARGR